MGAQALFLAEVTTLCLPGALQGSPRKPRFVRGSLPLWHLPFLWPLKSGLLWVFCKVDQFGETDTLSHEGLRSLLLGHLPDSRLSRAELSTSPFVLLPFWVSKLPPPSSLSPGPKCGSFRTEML